MRVARIASLTALLAALAAAQTLGAQVVDSTSHGTKTFLTRRDLGIAGVALGATALLSIWDPNIAQASSCDFTMQFETVAYSVLMKWNPSLLPFTRL